VYNIINETRKIIVERNIFMIKESGEDYLETILVIHNKKGFVRAVDIAESRGVSKPSVSRALSILGKSGFISVAVNGDIKLTEQGRARAESILERHRVIRDFFTDVLGVSPFTAESDACRVEHALSEETFEKFRVFLHRGTPVEPLNIE
jgi:Mn-dependent DtxR family transcriptional regulator